MCSVRGSFAAPVPRFAAAAPGSHVVGNGDIPTTKETILNQEHTQVSARPEAAPTPGHETTQTVTASIPSPHVPPTQQAADESEASQQSEPTAGETTPVPATTTFTALGILPAIVEALEAVGIVHPFPIQQMAIPIALTGTDMIGQARTGTGKTLAFGTALLQRIVVPGERDYAELARPGAPQALVVTPTRELASQVGSDLAIASSRRQARVLTVYGGVAYEPQLDALEAGVEVVVGTPGRLLDLANRHKLDLSHCKVVVLDEADEMLDLGFLPDVERLLAKTPELRQTMLFSATMPSAIVSLARSHLRHPVNIRAEHAGEDELVPTTAQFVYQAHDLDKPEIVGRVLQAEDRDKVMVFCRTKRAAQRLSDDLVERGFAAASIHGDLSQQAREKALSRFREGKIVALVATDVAARGIDVTGVSHVINYECPDDEKAYVHRIGRTGRAGASGIAVTFVDWADTTRWKVINRVLGLPFPDPLETYSTSEHLFTDLGIPHGVTGRLVAAPPRERQGAREHHDEPRQRLRRDSERTEVTTDDGTTRRHRRRRSGRGHGTGAASDAGAPGEPVTVGGAPAESGDSDAADRPSSGTRTRRRRRRGGRSDQG